MRTASVVRASVIVGQLFLGASVLQAQKLSFRPNIGLYIPTKEIVQQVAAGATTAR